MRPKSPTQLQRDIDEALSGVKALTPAQRAYVTALEEDVRLFPSAYKAAVRANPTVWAMKLAEGLNEVNAREMAREQRAETKRTLRTLRRAR